MKARTVDLGPTTAVAVMGTDVERIGQNFQSIHEMWASIIEVAVAIWLLEQQIFLACLAPVAVIISTSSVRDARDMFLIHFCSNISHHRASIKFCQDSTKALD